MLSDVFLSPSTHLISNYLQYNLAFIFFYERLKQCFNILNKKVNVTANSGEANSQKLAPHSLLPHSKIRVKIDHKQFF